VVFVFRRVLVYERFQYPNFQLVRDVIVKSCLISPAM